MTDIHDHVLDHTVEHDDARPGDPVGRLLYHIARWIAVAGGVLLFGLGLMTTWSIIGRSWNRAAPLWDFLGWDSVLRIWTYIGDDLIGGPIIGDWELMQVGTAVVACCFLPYCQIVRGNIIVDFFMNNAPPRLKAVCDFAGSLMFVVVAALITWRLYYGGLDMYSYRQRLTTINFEHWWVFPIIVPLMGFLVLIVVYTLWRDVANIATGRDPGERLSDR